MKKNLFILLFGFVFSSCSDLNIYSDDIIFISKGNSQLKITNQADNAVYYFIVEQNTAATINWAPGVGETYILSGKTVTVKYSEIYGLKTQIVNNYTKAIFYYWIGSDNSNFTVKNIVIDL